MQKQNLKGVPLPQIFPLVLYLPQYRRGISRKYSIVKDRLEYRSCSKIIMLIMKGHSVYVVLYTTLLRTGDVFTIDICLL